MLVYRRVYVVPANHQDRSANPGEKCWSLNFGFQGPTESSCCRNRWPAAMWDRRTPESSHAAWHRGSWRSHCLRLRKVHPPGTLGVSHICWCLLLIICFLYKLYTIYIYIFYIYSIYILYILYILYIYILYIYILYIYIFYMCVCDNYIRAKKQALYIYIYRIDIFLWWVELPCIHYGSCVWSIIPWSHDPRARGRWSSNWKAASKKWLIQWLGNVLESWRLDGWMAGSSFPRMWLQIYFGLGTCPVFVM